MTRTLDDFGRQWVTSRGRQSAAGPIGKFPGLKVLGLVVFPFTSVLQKTQSLSQSRVLFPRNWHVPDSHVTLA